MGKILFRKTILITGGTGALGTCFVRRAVREGASIFFTFHRNETQKQILTSEGARGFQLDLSDPRQIDTFVDEMRGRIKKLDVLIHNAAAVRDKLLYQMDENDWDDIININLKSPCLLTRKLLPFFETNRPPSCPPNARLSAGKIFMLISRAAFEGGAGMSNYAAAKAGLAGLTKSLARELGERRILVNAVNPGFMRSAMTQGLSPEIIGRNLEAAALKNYSDPDEVAEFLIYLCSDKVTQVTGQIFHFESRQTQ